MEGEQFILDTMTWSFSRLNSFYNCPHEWYCQYIEDNRGENGFFGEFGGACHKVLERYIKGEISIFDVSEEYEKAFAEQVVHDAPPNKYVDLKESYHQKGLNYFDNIDLDLAGYEILGVEKEVKFVLGGKPFVGYIDLLLKEKETGKIIICDHKSASIKINKNGSISKGDQDHFREFVRQLCLYAIPVIKWYGKVDELWWNMFKEQKWIKIPFTLDDYNEAIKWAEDTIKLIEAEKEYPCNPDYFYCNYLCSQRNNACEFKPQPIPKEESEPFNPENE